MSSLRATRRASDTRGRSTVSCGRGDRLARGWWCQSASKTRMVVVDDIDIARRKFISFKEKRVNKNVFYYKDASMGNMK